MKALAGIIVSIFTFTAIGMSYPKIVWAQELSKREVYKRELKLRNKIESLASRIEFISTWVLTYRWMKSIRQEKWRNGDHYPKRVTPIDTDFGVQPKKSEELKKEPQCQECWRHKKGLEIFLKKGPLLFPNIRDTKAIQKLVQDMAFNGLPKQPTPSHYLDHFTNEVRKLKRAVEKYLDLNLPGFYFAEILKSYIKVIKLYLTVDLLVYPDADAFDRIEPGWDYGSHSNMLASDLVLYMKASTVRELTKYMNKATDDMGVDEKKEYLKSIVYFKKSPSASWNRKEGKPVYYGMLFQDAFRINIELSSYLRQRTQSAWLKILKLMTVQYLGAQILNITKFWPETGEKNREFFNKLGRHFRSFKHIFGAMIDTAENEKLDNYNAFLAVNFAERPIPRIVTLKRYKDISSHSPLMRLFREKDLQVLMTKRNVGENERIATISGVRSRMLDHKTPLLDLSRKKRSKRVWEYILKVKRNFLKQHIYQRFVYTKPRRLSLQIAPKLIDKYMKEYRKEFTQATVMSWMTDFTGKTAKIQSGLAFEILSKTDIPAVVHKISRLDEQAKGMELHHLNRMVTWKAHFEASRGSIGETLPEQKHYPKLTDYWQGDRAVRHHAAGMARRPELGKDKDSLYTRSFPIVDLVPYKPENMKVLISQILVPLGNDPYLLNHGINSFSNVTDKKELLKKFKELRMFVSRHANTSIKKMGTLHTYLWYKPRMFFGDKPSASEKAHFEKEKYKEILQKLSRIGGRLSDVDPNDESALDDFFRNPDQKLSFLRTKRAIWLNKYRLLSVPMVSGTGVPKKRTLLDHLLFLKRQDGLLVSEVSGFIGKQKAEVRRIYNEAKWSSSYPMKDLTKLSMHNTSDFTRMREKAMGLKFKGKSLAEAKKMVREDDARVGELRRLELEVSKSPHLPYEAYFHPEYFVHYKGYISQKDQKTMMRIWTLRLERRLNYLNKGGAEFDQWQKSFVQELMIRHALIQQDIIIRGVIESVTQAKKIEDIKEYLLDPYILKNALTMVQDEFPDEQWRIKVFEKRHKEIVKKFSSNLMDAYKNSSYHTPIMWGSIFLAIVLTFIPGGQMPAAIIGGALLAEFTIVSLYELHDSFVVMPKILKRKEAFFLTSTSSKGGPVSMKELEHFRSGMFWKKVMSVGFTALFLVPWGRSEVMRAIRVFHRRANWFTALKIPLYARWLGIGEAEALTLPLIRRKIAQKIGLGEQSKRTRSTIERLRQKLADLQRWPVKGVLEKRAINNLKGRIKGLESQLAAEIRLTGEQLGRMYSKMERARQKLAALKAAPVKDKAAIKKMKKLLKRLESKFEEPFKKALGSHRGDKMMSMFRFFHNGEVKGYMWLQTVAKCQEALVVVGFREGQWPTLTEIRKQVWVARQRVINRRLSPTAKMTPDFAKHLDRKLMDIKDVVKFLESNMSVVLEMRYVAQPKAALESLGLSINNLPNKQKFSKIYDHLIEFGGTAEELAAARYLSKLYNLKGNAVAQLTKKAAHNGSKEVQEAARREMAEILRKIPRSPEWHLRRAMSTR